MSLRKRLLKVEETWYKLEADHYGAHWSELYDQDTTAEALGEAFDKVTDSTEPPYWFWPDRDEWQRKFGWAMNHTDEANALFSEMLDRLKRFVDDKASKGSISESRYSALIRRTSENKAGRGVRSPADGL